MTAQKEEMGIKYSALCAKITLYLPPKLHYINTRWQRYFLNVERNAARANETFPRRPRMHARYLNSRVRKDSRVLR